MTTFVEIAMVRLCILFDKNNAVSVFFEFLQDIKIASYHISFAVWLW